jgi:two-component system, cell cycle sensor histidine kinase and response regulator CckA
MERWLISKSFLILLSFITGYLLNSFQDNLLIAVAYLTFTVLLLNFVSSVYRKLHFKKLKKQHKNSLAHFTEENFIKNKSFLRRVIDTDPNLIFVKDASGRFTLVNQAVAQIYGTNIENIIGKMDSDFNPQVEEVECFRSDDKTVIEKQEDIFIAEEKITDAAGQIHWLQTIKRPLKLTEDGPVQVLGVATDITETKKLHEQLLQAQKMEAIGQLAGGVAHDFNNYLTGIIGYTGMLKICANQPKEVENTAQLIESIAQKAAQLTEKLLGFARKGKHQNISVDLHNSIRETITLLSRTIEKDITIIQHFCADNPFTTGDPMQIQQVILNLALNARDAIRAKNEVNFKGRIEVGTCIVKIPDEYKLEQSLLPPGQYLMLQVKDNGCGIDSSIQDRIFEPFFTTKEQSKGTGMGLAMVYGIVKNHGGALDVKSSPNVGTSFSIFLPSSKPPLKNKIEIERKLTVSGQGHILIVDDHQVIRDVTSRMLVSLGYDVVTARDGLDALKYYRENWSEIDLVILDMIMPNMGAKECFRELKQINPNVRAILSTGYDNNHSVQEILNEGMCEFVQKPYHIQKLSEIVDRVLHE